MLAKTFASAVQGVDAQTITVEINTGGPVAGDKNFYHLVGLPDNAVREGFQRIEAAVGNSGFRMTRVKTTVNLAPADIRKEGSAYDLPIAIGFIVTALLGLSILGIVYRRSTRSLNLTNHPA